MPDFTAVILIFAAICVSFILGYVISLYKSTNKKKKVIGELQISSLDEEFVAISAKVYGDNVSELKGGRTVLFKVVDIREKN